MNGSIGRKGLSIGAAMCMAASLLVVMAAPALATHAAVTILNPLDADNISSQGGTPVELTAITSGQATNGDADGVDHVHFYWMPTGGPAGSVTLIGTDNEAAVPNIGAAAPGFKAYGVDFDTGSIPNGSSIDIIAVACGDGVGGDDDHSSPFPLSDCGTGTSGPNNDTAAGITVNNTLPSSTMNAHHGAAESQEGFGVTVNTTPDTEQVEVALCNATVDATTGAEGAIPTYRAGAGCGFEVALSPSAGNTVWTYNFTSADITAAGGAGQYRLDAAMDNDPTASIQTASSTSQQHYITARPAAATPNHVHAVWVHGTAPGDGTCENGSNTASSAIDPWNQTATGADDPMLRICANNPSHGGLVGLPLAGETDTGFIDFGANVGRGPFVFDDPDADGISEPCTATPATTVRENLGYPACQNQGLSDGGGDYFVDVNSLQTGTQTITVCVDLDGNALCGAAEPAATATIDWGAAGEAHDHLKLSSSVAADPTCHLGQAGTTADTGTQVPLTGCAHDVAHNSVPNVPVVWRIGLTGAPDPAQFVGQPEQTTDASGQADAVVTAGAGAADQVSNIFFCTDANGDGVCDFAPATGQFQISWQRAAAEVVRHTRRVGFRLRVGSLVGRGRVTGGGFARCKRNVPVKIQKKKRGRFRTIRRTSTNRRGRYSSRFPERRGRYRAVAPRVRRFDGQGTRHICRKDVSPVRRFRG
jgi:hypothetical protein